MSKAKIFTIGGILLSFAIAAVGWVLTSTLINIKSDALLSAIGIITMNAPEGITTSPPPYIGDDRINGQQQSGFSEFDIIPILQNWESPGREALHEPTAEQISMRDAYGITSDFIAFLDEQGIIAEEMWELHSSSAYLCQNLMRYTYGQDGQFLEQIYSYWTVKYTGETMDATFIINAVTGQVWKCNVVFVTHPYKAIDELSNNDFENTLTAFMSSIGIKSDAESNIVNEIFGTKAFKSFADNGAYAMFNINGRLYEGKLFLAELNLSLYMSIP